jgi:short-subunit dehydrogenase
MIIWITGASTGLGREVARQYAHSGHTVAVSARGADGLSSLAEACSGANGSIHAYPLDVTDHGRVAAGFAQIEADLGAPDLVILNAGTNLPDSAVEFDRAIYARLMEINFMGVVNCLAPVLPAMIERRSGRVAVVASVAGYRGLPYAAAYCASKSALISMCESLQPELAAAGVGLHLVDPGFVRTPLTDRNDFDMPFLMEVEDAAAAMIGGIDQGRFEITFPKRFTWLVKSTRFLPFGVFLRLTRNLLKSPAS